MIGLLRVFYFVSLASLGAFFPFLSARLEAAGVGGVGVGLLLAMGPVGRLVSAPIWAWVADRWRMAGTLLRIGCAVALLGATIVWMSDSPAMAAVGIVLFAMGRAPTGPLVDALTLDAIADRAEYGKVRLWGSVGFCVSALASGELSDRGVDPMVPGIALLAATLACAFAFPTRGEGGPAPVMPALRALLRSPWLVPFLATGFLQAMTLSVYDTFFAQHVRALGLPDVVTGAAVAVGVVCEVAMMRMAGPVLARWGAPRVLLAATIAAVPRWLLTAWVTDPFALVATQALHGVAFGAFWIAGVQAMSERAPREVSASAQSLFSAASYGFGALAGALIAGWVRAAWGTAAIFEVMAGVSVLAIAAAGMFVARDVTIGDRSADRAVS
ncbi:MAG: MFS transporter [Myxococcota bacterium]